MQLFTDSTPGASTVCSTPHSCDAFVTTPLALRGQGDAVVAVAFVCTRLVTVRDAFLADGERVLAGLPTLGTPGLSDYVDVFVSVRTDALTQVACAPVASHGLDASSGANAYRNHGTRACH